MTLRIHAAALTAAFSFGTAFGAALTAPWIERYPAQPISTQKLTGAIQDNDPLVCGPGADGKTLCWPKSLAPGAGTSTQCAEADGITLCQKEPIEAKPQLDL